MFAFCLQMGDDTSHNLQRYASLPINLLQVRECTGYLQLRQISSVWMLSSFQYRVYENLHKMPLLVVYYQSAGAFSMILQLEFKQPIKIVKKTSVQSDSVIILVLLVVYYQ